MRVLVVNAGSSSLKLRVLGADDQLELSDDVPVSAGRIDVGALGSSLERVGTVHAVGHRIVHGGSEFLGPVRMDAKVERRLRALADLAPLHQPRSLAALRAVTEALADVPAVACFDTAFHATLPLGASTYALPAEWRLRWDLRRFGFHGLSASYASRRVAELLGRPADGLRIVVCHLGAGASVTAVKDGRSVDTTMGFTPLEGLVMATRSGSLDPGLVIWLEEHVGMPPAELAATLEHRSGLKGLAGSADMRQVLELEAGGSQQAGLAIEVYLHRLRASIAAMAAAMDGLDALVFTGGVGERSRAIRDRAAAGLSFLGIGLNEARAGADEGDHEISSSTARVRTFVVISREDLEIARQVRETLSA